MMRSKAPVPTGKALERLENLCARSEQCAPYVAVGEGSGHFAVRLSHEQRHSASRQPVKAIECLQERGVGSYNVLFHRFINVCRLIMVSAASQSAGPSISMLLSRGITEGTLWPNIPIGMARSDAGFMAYTAPLYTHALGASCLRVSLPSPLLMCR